MKKTKLLTTGFITSLAAISAPVMSLTSCNKQSPTTPGIDIKVNANIKIECDRVEQGQDVYIKYTLDQGYAFNMEKSTIMFANSNAVIYLIQCEIERDNNTIKVPYTYVTSNSVVIDIKAESNKSAQLDSQAEYEAAWNNITTVSDERKYTMDIVGIMLEEGTYYNVQGYTKANGWQEDYFVAGSYETETETKITAMRRYAERYSGIMPGFWSYSMEYEGGEAYEDWEPTYNTFVYCWLSQLPSSLGITKFSSLKFDDLINAYYLPNSGSTVRKNFWIKFNSDKKISSFASSSYESGADAGMVVAELDYVSTPIIDPPELKPSENNKFIFGTNKFAKEAEIGVKCASSSETNGLGRFSIPLKDLFAFDLSKEIKISGLGQTDELLIYDGRNTLQSGIDYTVQNNIVIINANCIDTSCSALTLCNISAIPRGMHSGGAVTVFQGS